MRLKGVKDDQRRLRVSPFLSDQIHYGFLDLELLGSKDN